MFAQWWLEILEWISPFLSMLGGFIITPGISFIGFVLACSIISMMITTFISRGHE